MRKYYFILGALDPEMKEIERFLLENKQSFAISAVDGVRVNVGNTYLADTVLIPEGLTPVIIETEPRNFGEWREPIRIDHHRPGDFGYDLNYEKFFEASSLGQLLKLLDVAPTHAQYVLSALDHCFNDALQGKCHGVSAEEVLGLKIEHISAETNLTIDQIRSKIDLWLIKIKNSADYTTLDSNEIVNMTKYDLGAGYTSDLLAAQIASVLSGKSVLLKHRDSEDSSLKVTINGNNTPQTMKYFEDVFCELNKLKNLYGVVNRKYAGAYFSIDTKDPLKLTNTPTELKSFTDTPYNKLL